MEPLSDIVRIAAAAERVARALDDLDVSMRACASALQRIDLTMRGRPIPAWLMNLDEVQEQIDKMLEGAE